MHDKATLSITATNWVKSHFNLSQRANDSLMVRVLESDFKKFLKNYMYIIHNDAQTATIAIASSSMGISA
jgi:hypothetical protein